MNNEFIKYLSFGVIGASFASVSWIFLYLLVVLPGCK